MTLLFRIAVTLLVCSLPTVVSAVDQTFTVSFPSSIRQAPYTGRVYLFTTQRSGVEPRQAMSWFRPEPMLAIDVQNWTGSDLTIDPRNPEVFKYPQDWSGVDLTGRRVQAVTRFNPWDRNVGTGAGNGFSAPVEVASSGPVSLTIQQLVPEQNYQGLPWSQEFVVRSNLLSRFAGREVVLKGAVNLPPGYETSPGRRYPVIFNIPGFGGTHEYHERHSSHWYRTPAGHPGFTNSRGVEFIEVVLDPSCPLGHHVFADSDNNGPWGTALVKEFIPALDARFRTDPRPQARFLTGHSSGGWSSLWLQVAYPDSFGGTWSTAPDPVDFRDFQRINLYRPGENMFVDSQQQRRPLARVNGEVLLWYDGFNRMEDLLGYGGQLHSFEAVFGPRNSHRRPADRINPIDAPPESMPQPALLWNRSTGEIDLAVAEAWKRYDIRLILETHWPTLGPKLAGKLHVIMGTEDTFYLEGATRLLKESLANLGSDAVVELVEGRDHMNLLDAPLRKRIEQEMAEAWLKAGN